MTSLIIVTPGVKNLQGINASIKVPKIQTHSLVNWGTGSVIDTVAKFTESTSSTLGILYENSYTIGIINGLEELIKILPSTTKTIDLLTCNINKQNDIDQIKSLEKTYNITIRYSIDLTGHPDSMGNWILESHNVSVRDKYFNNMITEWKHVLHDSEADRMNWIRANTTTTPAMTDPTGKTDDAIRAEINTITSITINANVTEIPDMTFDNRIPNVTSITTATDENGHSSLTRIGNQAFMGQPAAGKTCDVNIIFDTAEDAVVDMGAFAYRHINTLSIQNTSSGTYSIGQMVFMGTEFVSPINLSNLTGIGLMAFMMEGPPINENDINISFNVSGNVEIGQYTFYYRKIGTLSISNEHPSGTYSIGTQAFAEATISSNLTLSNLTGIGNHAFMMSTLSSYEINVTIEFNVSGDAVIGEQAFSLRDINTLSIQNTLGTYSLVAYSFYDTPIKVLDLKPGISSIGERAFMMPAVDTQQLDVSLSFNVSGDTILPRKLFTNRTLNSVSLSNVHPTGTYSIGNEAFKNTEIISNLTLGNGLTSIGAEAFMMSSLSQNEIDVTITFNMAEDGTIGRHAFYQRKIGTLTIQNTLGTYSIGIETFYDTPIKVIDLKPAISSIGERAFMMTEPDATPIDVSLSFEDDGPVAVSANLFGNRTLQSLSINSIENVSGVPDGMIDGDYLSSSENLTNKIVLGTSKSVILSNTNIINNTKFLNVTFDQNSIQYLQNKSVALIDCTIEN